tara:strand:- start:16634 stop:16957 length:324 start_codon:yes stop_codon:yes gene_type:complete
MSYRKAEIFAEKSKAGILEETENGYRFEYDADYIAKKASQPVSLTLPLTEETYESKVLFSFFDGLIPEGWLLNVVENTWKINSKDRMGLLLVSCKDTIGNISVREYE